MLDKLWFLQTRLDGLDEKFEGLDTLNAQIDELPINELTLRVDSLEHKVAQEGSFERGGDSMSSVAHIEECVEELDCSQKTMLKFQMTFKWL